MKVLIETTNKRRGYKFFKNKDDMNAYLGRHYDKIATYEILKEDDTESTNDILRDLAQECEMLHNKLFFIFRQQEKLKKANQYEQLIYAAGKIYEACGAIRKCIQ